MRLEVSETFLEQFIINSLPPAYGPLHTSYNTIKDNWNINELQSMLIQEEARFKKQGIHSVNLMGQQGARKKLGKKNGKVKQGPLKINVSSVQIHNLI